MTENDFLSQVAAYLIDDDSHRRQLNRTTLVFPNKRSALFMKKALHRSIGNAVGRPAFMPRFATMSRLVARFADRPAMSRRESLFLLYNTYRSVLERRNRSEQLKDFDRFVFWGDMILDDFDDIDRHLVNAAKLFKNLKDLKEINADYLDENQKQIIRQIWGETAHTAAVTEFWTHTGDNGEVVKSFINLWEILGELYVEFHRALDETGQTTPGFQYRLAAEIIGQMSVEDLRRERFVFIGFNDLSHSETMMFKRFKEAGVASFFWDFESPVFKDGENLTISRTFGSLLRNFPMPDGFSLTKPEARPTISVIGIPSNIAQTKLLDPMLDRLADEGRLNVDNAINTAVILPDASLLMPSLFAIPGRIEALNITMGIPFASTPFAAFLKSIITLQLRARLIHGEFHFYHEDVLQLLSHPHILSFASSSAEKIKSYISANCLYNIPAAYIVETYPELAYIFRAVKQLENVDELQDYLHNLLTGLRNDLSATSPTFKAGRKVEVRLLDNYLDEIEQLGELIKRYRISMSESTYFTLFEKLLNASQINLQGTPLRGLQIMGVLETRALDFDNLIILSMNERVFPRKSYIKTMIPNNLRIGYGMPSIDRQDSLYTYYFYHMLTRAKNVTLVYDSRVGALGAGEMSRYISQLKHLNLFDRITFDNIAFSSEVSNERIIKVDKTPAVLDELKTFTTPGGAFISASALKSYKRCRLQFYLQYVRNMRGTDEQYDYMTAAQHGTIIHRVIEQLLMPFEGKHVDAAAIDAILKAPGLIKTTIDSIITEVFYPKAKETADGHDLPAEGNIFAGVIDLYVRKMLGYEQTSYCTPSFRYIKGEMAVADPQWRVTDGLTINFKMSIDRVDEIEPGHLRFIDYKTGADKSAVGDIDRLFVRGKHDYDAIFQILTYCEAYADMVDPGVSIKPIIYPFRNMVVADGIVMTKIGKDEIEDYRSVSAEFRPRLNEMISEIFDPAVPFDRAEDPKSCAFCPFLELCDRQVPEF